MYQALIPPITNSEVSNVARNIWRTLLPWMDWRSPDNRELQIFPRPSLHPQGLHPGFAVKSKAWISLPQSPRNCREIVNDWVDALPAKQHDAQNAASSINAQDASNPMTLPKKLPTASEKGALGAKLKFHWNAVATPTPKLMHTAKSEHDSNSPDCGFQPQSFDDDQVNPHACCQSGPQHMDAGSQRKLHP